MTIPKLTLPILEAGYTVSEPASAIAVGSKGGFSRTRADLDDGSVTVTVGWKLSVASYSQLLNFFRVGTKYGSLPFAIDLVIDNSLLTTSTAYFNSDGPQVTQVTGLNYFVNATLEVIPNMVDTAFDAGVVAVFNASNGDPVPYLNLFDQIVNVKWPT
jgi:hypothetical protein